MLESPSTSTSQSIQEPSPQAYFHLNGWKRQCRQSCSGRKTAIPRVEMCCAKICKSQMGTFCPERQKHNRDLWEHMLAQHPRLFVCVCVCVCLSIYLFGCVGSQLHHVESSSHHVGSFFVVHTLEWWHAGLVAVWHVGSSFPSQALNLCPLHCKADHQTTREGPGTVSFTPLTLPHSSNCPVNSALLSYW